MGSQTITVPSGECWEVSLKVSSIDPTKPVQRGIQVAQVIDVALELSRGGISDSTFITLCEGDYVIEWADQKCFVIEVLTKSTSNEQSNIEVDYEYVCNEDTDVYDLHTFTTTDGVPAAPVITPTTIPCGEDDFEQVSYCNTVTGTTWIRASSFDEDSVETILSDNNTGVSCVSAQIDVEVDYVCNSNTNVYDRIETVFSDGVLLSSVTTPTTIACDEDKPDFEQVRVCRNDTIHVVTTEIDGDGVQTEISAVDTLESCGVEDNNLNLSWMQIGCDANGDSVHKADNIVNGVVEAWYKIGDDGVPSQAIPVYDTCDSLTEIQNTPQRLEQGETFVIPAGTKAFTVAVDASFEPTSEGEISRITVDGIPYGIGQSYSRDVSGHAVTEEDITIEALVNGATIIYWTEPNALLANLTSKTFTTMASSFSNIARAGEYIEASDGTLYASGEVLPASGDYTWWYDASNPIAMSQQHYVSHFENMDDIQRMTPARLGGGHLGYQGMMDFTDNLTVTEIVNPYSTYGWNTLFPTILQGAVNLEELALGYYPGGVNWGTVDLPLLKKIFMSSYAPNRLAGSFDLTRAINLEEIDVSAIGITYAGEPLIVNINSPVNTVTINSHHKMFVGNELELSLKSISEAAVNTNTTNGTLTFGGSGGNPIINTGSNSCGYLQTLFGLGWDIIGLSGTSTCSV